MEIRYKVLQWIFLGVVWGGWIFAWMRIFGSLVEATPRTEVHAGLGKDTMGIID